MKSVTQPKCTHWPGSLRKQTTFCNATNSFPAKWHVRNECRNSILKWHSTTNQKQYPDLGSNGSSSAARISALVSQTSFCGKTVGGIVTCLLFFEAIGLDDFIFINFSALKQNKYYSSCKKLDGPPIHHKVFLKLPLSSTLTRPHMESTTMLFCPSMGGLSPVIKSIKPS